MAQFMVNVDSTITVALPDIQANLHMPTSALTWVLNAYTLTFAGFLLLGGRAADVWGRRSVFMSGVSFFTHRPFPPDYRNAS
jgi:MFS family permease